MLHYEMVYEGECATRGMLLPHQQQFAPSGEDAVAPFLCVSTWRTRINISPLWRSALRSTGQVQLYAACLLSTQSAWALRQTCEHLVLPLTWRTA